MPRRKVASATQTKTGPMIEADGTWITKSNCDVFLVSCILIVLYALKHTSPPPLPHPPPHPPSPIARKIASPPREKQSIQPVAKKVSRADMMRQMEPIVYYDDIPILSQGSWNTATKGLRTCA